jgi:antitoxin VapB
MRPRRKQTPITIRSDRAAERLALLTRSGRSQAEIIEDALEKVALEPSEEAERQAFMDRIDEITRRAAARPRKWRSLAEFDEATYDERGLPK